MRNLRLLFGVLFFLSALERNSEALEKPNIVLILADDLGAHDLGCDGRTGHRTPHIDRLAAEGKRFTSAYAQPVCSPSRAALMTGQHPARLLITTFLSGRPDWPGHRLLQPVLPAGLATDRPVLAERLRESGYATGFVGKWHLGERPPFDPASRGFDFVFSGGLKKDSPEAEFSKGERIHTEKALGFLEAQAARPFFLYLALNNPHVPLRAARDRVEAQAGAFHPTYAAMMEALDGVVGRVMEKLDALGLREKTLVVFASDNGGVHVPELQDAPPTFNKPLRAGKGFLYEGGIRVPLIVRWPTNITSGVIDTPVSIADLHPTLLDLAGLSTQPPSDFFSLKPLLWGEGSGSERALIWHMPNYTNQGGRPSGAIREGDWKLVEQYEDGRLELYNLRSDPSEKTDVSAGEAARVAAMRGKLEAWRRETGVLMPKPNPAFAPALWKACYEEVDVSRWEARATAAETGAPLKAWRAAMDRILQPVPKGDARATGLVILEARSADVHAHKLRYEFPPQKDTLGFWVDASDWVSWDCVIPEAGQYAVEVLQGCGKGSSGSQVEVTVGEKPLNFYVEETGHFQRFVPRQVGVLDLPQGKTTVSVKVLQKKGGAVMDLRRLTLVRVP
jgi:arylsulfatase A-like enzyme